jgi:FkbM family methyltransferase
VSESIDRTIDSRPSWRQQLWVWYLRRPGHWAKLRVERWLATALRLRRVRLPIPGPAVLDLPMGEHLTTAIARGGCYEKTSLELVLSLCRTADCFVDVGAQFGQYTLAVSAVLPPQGRVVAVEPNPVNYLGLCRNLELNARSNVLPVLAAAGEQNGLLRLEPAPAGNTGKTTTRPDVRCGSMIVPSYRLSDLLRQLNIDYVDVVKMDVEGFEPAVLRGLLDSSLPPPRHIIFEFIPQVFPSGLEAMRLLDDAGYRIRQVSGEQFITGKKPLDDNLWATLDL